MRRRIISTILRKGQIFLGTGSPPTFWPFIVCPRTAMAAEGVSFSVTMYYSELVWGSTYTESQSYTVLDLVGFNQFMLYPQWLCHSFKGCACPLPVSVGLGNKQTFMLRKIFYLFFSISQKYTYHLLAYRFQGIYYLHNKIIITSMELKHLLLIHSSHCSEKLAHSISFNFWHHLVEKAIAPHSNTLAWKIPWASEEPGRLQTMGSLRVGHDRSDLAAAAVR